jgi:hypothetical protein
VSKVILLSLKSIFPLRTQDQINLHFSLPTPQVSVYNYRPKQEVHHSPSQDSDSDSGNAVWTQVALLETLQARINPLSLSVKSQTPNVDLKASLHNGSSFLPSPVNA